MHPRKSASQHDDTHFRLTDSTNQYSIVQCQTHAHSGLSQYLHETNESHGKDFTNQLSFVDGSNELFTNT